MTALSILLTGVIGWPLTIGASEAEIYRWTDGNGTTHFSDKRPPDHQSEKLAPPKPQIISVPEPPSPARDKTHMRRPRKPRSPHYENPAIYAEINIELDTLRRAEAVFRDDVGHYHTHRSAFSRYYRGQRTYVDEKARSKLIASLQNRLKRQCDPSPQAQRALSIEQAKLARQRDCELLTHSYEERANRKFRIPKSELKALKALLDASCQGSPRQ